MKHLVARLWNEEEGQDLIEYVLLVVLIGLLAAAGFPAFATAIDGQFNKIVGCLNNGAGVGC